MNAHGGYVLAQVIRVERLPSPAGIWRILQRWHELARVDDSALKNLHQCRWLCGHSGMLR